MSKESRNIMCMWRNSTKPSAETVVPYNRLLYPFDLAMPLPHFVLSLPMPYTRNVERKFEGATLLDLFQQIYDIYNEKMTEKEIEERCLETGAASRYIFTVTYNEGYHKIQEGGVVLRRDFWDKRSPIFLDFSNKGLPFKSIWIYDPP